MTHHYLIEKVGQYYFSAPEHRAEILRACREFFDLPDLDENALPKASVIEVGLFNEWFLYDFVLPSGETPLACFVRENPLRMLNEDMVPYRSLLKHNTYGIFEVKHVDAGMGLELENLQTKEIVFVHEERKLYPVRRGNIFFGRIGRIEDGNEFVGANTFSFEGIDDRSKFELGCQRFAFTPKIAYGFLKFSQGQVLWKS